MVRVAGWGQVGGVAGRPGGSAVNDHNAVFPSRDCVCCGLSLAGCTWAASLVVRLAGEWESWVRAGRGGRAVTLESHGAVYDSAPCSG
jgi:hypothetical protein